MRETLLLSAELLARKGLLPAAQVQAIRAGQGAADTAADLIALVSLFTGAWDRVATKVPVEPEELTRATALAAELLTVTGDREVPGPARGEGALEDRARAFTLLVRAYDECRRAVAFIRWHAGDAEAIAPSLYRRRARGKRVEEAPVEGSASAEGPSAPRAV